MTVNKNYVQAYTDILAVHKLVEDWTNGTGHEHVSDLAMEAFFMGLRRGAELAEAEQSVQAGEQDGLLRVDKTVHDDEFETLRTQHEALLAFVANSGDAEVYMDASWNADGDEEEFRDEFEDDNEEFDDEFYDDNKKFVALMDEDSAEEFLTAVQWLKEL